MTIKAKLNTKTERKSKQKQYIIGAQILHGDTRRPVALITVLPKLRLLQKNNSLHNTSWLLVQYFMNGAILFPSYSESNTDKYSAGFRHYIQVFCDQRYKCPKV